MAKINRITRSSSSLVTLAELQSGSELFSKTTVRRTQITPELSGTAALVKRAEVIRRVIDHIVYSDAVSGAQFFAEYLLPVDSALLLLIRGRLAADAVFTSDTATLTPRKSLFDQLDVQEQIKVLLLTLRTLQETVLMQSQPALSLSKSLQPETISTADQFSLQLGVGVFDALQIQEIINLLLNVNRLFEDAVQAADQAGLGVSKPLQDTQPALDVFSTLASKTLAEFVNEVDQLAKTVTNQRTDDVQILDVLTQNVGLTKTEILQSADQSSLFITATRDDAANILDLASIGTNKLLEHAISMLDQGSRFSLIKFLSDDVVPLDLANVFDGITYSYGLSRAFSVGVSDAFTPSAVYFRSLTDAASTAERISLGQFRLPAETLTLSDVKALRTTKLRTDAASITDVFLRTQAAQRKVQDLLTAAESSVRAVSLKKADTQQILDQLLTVLFKLRREFDVIVLSDAKYLSVSKSLTDDSSTQDADQLTTNKQFVRYDVVTDAISSLTQTNGVFNNSQIWDSSTSVVVSTAGTGRTSADGFATWDHFRFTSGTANRLLTSNPIDFTKYPRVDFLYIAGTGTNGGELPDSGENLILEYLHVTNGWTTALTIIAGGQSTSTPRGWIPFSYNFAATTSGLVSNVTRFRIRQNAASGSGSDTYGVANVVLRGGEFTLSSDYKKFSIFKLLADTVITTDLAGIFDGLNYQYGLGRTEAVITADVLQRIFLAQRVLEDAQQINDVFRRVYGSQQRLSDDQSSLDFISLTPGLGAKDSLVIPDFKFFSLTKGLSDAVAQPDDVRRAHTAVRGTRDGFADTLNLASPTFYQVNKTAKQGVNSTVEVKTLDSLTVGQSSILLTRTTNDTDLVGAVDFWRRAFIAYRSSSDTVTAADAYRPRVGKNVSSVSVVISPGGVYQRTVTVYSQTITQSGFSTSLGIFTSSVVDRVTHGYTGSSWSTIRHLGTGNVILTRVDSTSWALRSTDSGASWTPVNLSLYDQTAAVTGNDNFVLIASPVTSIVLSHGNFAPYKSTDGGATWTVTTASYTQNANNTGFFNGVYNSVRGRFFSWFREYVSSGGKNPTITRSWRYIYDNGVGSLWNQSNSWTTNTASTYYPVGVAYGTPSGSSVGSVVMLTAGGFIYTLADNEVIGATMVNAANLTINAYLTTGYIAATHWGGDHLAFGNGTFVAVDELNYAWYSTNVATWTRVALPDSTGVTLNAVLYDSSTTTFVVIGNSSGTVRTWSSTDGSSWTGLTPTGPTLSLSSNTITRSTIIPGAAAAGTSVILTVEYWNNINTTSVNRVTRYTSLAVVTDTYITSEVAINTLTPTSGTFTNSLIWDSAIGITAVASGTGSGSAGGFSTYPHFVFGSSGSRILTSKLFAGGFSSLSTRVIAGNSANGGDQPEAGENLIFEYNTAGDTWTTGTQITTASTWGFTSISLIALGINLSSSTPIRIRIRQTANSGSGFDNYGIADNTISGYVNNITIFDYSSTFTSSVQVSEATKDIGLRAYRGTAGSTEVKTRTGTLTANTFFVQSSVLIGRGARSIDDVGAVDSFIRTTDTRRSLSDSFFISNVASQVTVNTINSGVITLTLSSLTLTLTSTLTLLGPATNGGYDDDYYIITLPWNVTQNFNSNETIVNNTVYFSTNGYFRFEQSNSPTSPGAIPTSPENFTAPVYYYHPADLVAVSSWSGVVGTTPNRTYVVQHQFRNYNVPAGSNADTGYAATMILEVRFYEAATSQITIVAGQNSSSLIAFTPGLYSDGVLRQAFPTRTNSNSINVVGNTSFTITHTVDTSYSTTTYVESERIDFNIGKGLLETPVLQDTYKQVFNSSRKFPEALTAGLGIAPRVSGDDTERTVFDISKLMKQGANSTVSGVTIAAAARGETIKVGQQYGLIRFSGDAQERISFSITKLFGDGVVSNDFLQTFDGLTYSSTMLERETLTAGLGIAIRVSGSDTERTPFSISMLMKQGTDFTVSGVTIAAAARGETIRVGQRYGNLRLSQDNQELIVFNYSKTLPAGSNNTVVSMTDALRRDTTSLFSDSLTLQGRREGNFRYALTQGTRDEQLSATDVSTLINRMLRTDLSGDLDPFGNINTMVSQGSLRMTNYVDISYLENDYVGTSRSFS
jgi:hypothetical protein